MDINELSVKQLEELQRQLPSLIDTKRRDERKANLKSKAKVLTRLRPRIDKLEDQYQDLDGTEVTEQVTFTLKIKGTVNTDLESLVYLESVTDDHYCPVDLFNFEVGHEVLGNYTDEQREMLESEIEGVLYSICGKGFEILAPKCYKKLVTFCDRLNALADELKKEGLSLEDFDEE